jgi:hypothetical protein
MIESCTRWSIAVVLELCGVDIEHTRNCHRVIKLKQRQFNVAGISGHPFTIIDRGILFTAVVCNGSSASIPGTGDGPERQYLDRGGTTDNYVRIDHVEQAPEIGDQAVRVDRFHVDSTQFLWIYVYATLPSGSVPQGEYLKEIDLKPDPSSSVPLDAPEFVDGVYKFSLIHYVLSPKSRYWFHFADNLKKPAYQDQWAVGTLPDLGTATKK